MATKLDFLKIEEVTAAVAKVIEGYRHEAEVRNILFAAVFQKWEGKLINKRIESDAKEALVTIDPQMKVHYHRELEPFSTYRLNIWTTNPEGIRTGWDKRMVYYLARGKRARLDLNYLKENNIAYEFSAERAEVVKARIKYIPEAIAQYNEAVRLYHRAIEIGFEVYKDSKSPDLSVYPYTNIFSLSQSNDWKRR